MQPIDETEERQEIPAERPQSPAGSGDDSAVLLITIFLVVYLLLQLVILPKLGIST